MHTLNRIFHNKPLKPLWYLKCFIGYAIPKRFFQKRIARVLKKAEKRADWEYILQRVNYYNRLEHPTIASTDNYSEIGLHRYGKQCKSTYFFDTYRFTRWFPDNLKWAYEFGDVTHVPDIPSIVKSRPINGDNRNSVLLKLDSLRHFVFLKDDTAFKDKSDRAIFRLEVRGRPHRIRFVEKFFGSEICDTGISSPVEGLPVQWVKPHISMYRHLDYKFVMALEGYDVATNLKWIMSSNSLAVMPRPKYETWFMEGTLKPGYHYVEIRDDYGDLEEKLRYYTEHIDEAEAIITHAHEYVRQFFDRKRETIISLLVLKKYFVQTGQMEYREGYQTSAVRKGNGLQHRDTSRNCPSGKVR